MALTLRADKGEKLTHDELDANFTYLEGKIGSGVSIIDIIYLTLILKKSAGELMAGSIYRITDKSNILVLATSSSTFVQINKSRAVLTLVAETPYTYNYDFEVLEAFTIPKILAYDSSGEPVAVKVTSITKTSLILTSAVDCTVRIEI